MIENKNYEDIELTAKSLVRLELPGLLQLFYFRLVLFPPLLQAQDLCHKVSIY